MPWEAVLGGATGGVALAIVLAVVMFKLLAEKVIEGYAKRFEVTLNRVEELHRSTLALTTAVDTDLRQKRIDVYTTLWEKTGVLSRWPRNEDLVYKELRVLTAQLRDWFFKGGGIYLSAGARDAYGEVQQTLTNVLAHLEKLKLTDDDKVVTDDYDAILGKCSALRTKLTDDLLSRREAPSLKIGPV